MLVERQRPVRVGFVMHKMEVAGAEVLVKQMIDRLGPRIEPTVLCLDGIGELGEQLIASGVPVISMDRQPGVDWSVAGKIAKQVRLRNIEVLHAHQYSPFFYAACAKLRYRLKAQIMFTEHGRPYPDIVSWKRRLVNRMCLQRLASVTTACCDFSTHALKQVDGFSKAFTLRNGVDLKDLPARGSAAEVQQRQRQLGLNPKNRYVACVARMHPIKDHATLIRGWKLLNEQVPNAKLLLVGDGPERAAIERQIAAAGLVGSVELWGVRHDVPKILRAVDAVALTSMSEAASLTLLEAMACECPCVVTDVGGNAEHLREGIDGYLVPRGDARLVAARLAELLSDSALRARLGAAARQRVAANFSLNDAIESYGQHFETLAGRTPSQTSIAPAVMGA